MKFLDIRLTNFRQFKGEQTLDLNTTRERPVAMLFGANGSGKTTLLNAFTWCLYGKMSDDVEQQGRLITDTVWSETPAGSEAIAKVELRFEHEGHSYVARRTAKALKESDTQRTKDSSLVLISTDAEGASIEEPAPQERIDAILPQGLSAFFFFNGERIEKLTNRNSYMEIRDDIKALLGIEQVERALKHLPKVESRFGKAVQKYGGEQAATIQIKIEKRSDVLAKATEKTAALKDELHGFRNEREAVHNELRRHEGVAELQKQYDESESELKDARSSLEAARAHKRALLGSRGFLAFTEYACHQTQAMASALYEKGKLPAPLKRELVDKLIHEETCICGTVLTPGSPELARVADWRQRAGLMEVEAGWQRLDGQLNEMLKAREELRDSLAQVSRRIEESQERVHRLEEVMARVTQELRGSPLEDVSQLASKGEEIEVRIGQITGDLALCERDRDEAAKEIKALETEQHQAAIADGVAHKSQARLELVRSVKSALAEIFEIRSAEMRERLDHKVKEVFAAITTKPFEPELGTDFELKLFQKTTAGRLSVPKSTGENQILSLSFVAAVSEIAREIRLERSETEGDLGDAGSYPIVMDAAFGSLDENYQEEVSRVLANMAPQLVVLVSKSQGLGKVISVLEPSVQRMAVVVTHSSNKVHELEEIELRGHKYPYVVTKQDADWSELKEIR